MRRAASLFALLLVVALLAPSLLAPATASPQPSPICPFCGSSFEEAADQRGANATVTESTVTVRVHENGSATWVVRNRLASGADRFRADPGLLDRTGERLAEEIYEPVADVTLVSARMDGDTAVLTYRDPDGATRRAGLLVVDYLHDEGYGRWYVVNADRFTIRGPEGTVVTNDPDSGRADGTETASAEKGADRVTLRGESTTEGYAAPTLVGSPYVVFGPDRSAVTQARTTLALALATLPIVERSVRTYLLFQTALFGVALGVVVAILRSRTPGGDPQRWGGAVALLGAVGALVPAVAHAPRWVLGPPIFGAGIGLLAVHPRTRNWLGTPRRQALAAGGVLVATFLALVGLTAVLTDSRTGPSGEALRFTASVFPLAAMLPLGSVLTADRRTLLGWGALAVAAFAAIPAALIDFADPPSGLGSGLLAVALLVLAILAPVFGVALLGLGRSLAAGDAAD